jgi:glucokinase
VEAQTLAKQLGLPTVGLINDLETNAYGIAKLTPADFVILNQGDPEEKGNAVLISAGTGLGEVGMCWDGK